MDFDWTITRELVARSLQMTERVLAATPDGVVPDVGVMSLRADLLAWDARYGDSDGQPVRSEQPAKMCGALGDDPLEASDDWHLR